MARIGSGDLAQVVADSAVSAYKASHSPAEAQRAAESIAAQRGLTMTSFYMDTKIVSVTVSAPPRRTFLIHRIEKVKSLLSVSSTAAADIESPVN